eukprot:SM000050S17017  [mRNA]  locus=s50:471351:474542:- [translate_table: standard]
MAELRAELRREGLVEPTPEWRSARRAAVVADVAACRPGPLVKLLNAQRAWLGLDDGRLVARALLERGDVLRAVRVRHRVPCRSMFLPASSPLGNAVAALLVAASAVGQFFLRRASSAMATPAPYVQLYKGLIVGAARLSKMSRVRELLAMLAEAGRAPDAETYVAVIEGYLAEDVDNDDAVVLERAWEAYRSMGRFGEHKPSPALQEKLLKATAASRWGWQFAPDAEVLARDLASLGSQEIGCERYGMLIRLAGRSGDLPLVDKLMTEMAGAGFQPGAGEHAAVIQACARLMPGRKQMLAGGLDAAGEVSPGRSSIDGLTELGLEPIVERAEQALASILSVNQVPSASDFCALIQICFDAGLLEKAEATYQSLKESGVAVAYEVGRIYLEVLRRKKLLGKALDLLKDMKDAGVSPLEAMYTRILHFARDLDDVKAAELLVEDMAASGLKYTMEVCIALLDLYTKGGHMDKARHIYDGMRSPLGLGVNSVVFCLMLEGYGRVGNKEAIKEVHAYMTARSAKKYTLTREAQNHLLDALGEEAGESQEQSPEPKLVPQQREALVGALLGGARVVPCDGSGGGYGVELVLPERLVGHFAMLYKGLLQDVSTSDAASAASDHSQSDSRSTEEAGGPRSVAAPSHIPFKLRSHRSLQFYFHQYNPGGSPRIPPLIHRWLHPRVLAYWYMYSGHFCPSSGSLVFQAGKYPQKEVKLVLKTLKFRAVDCSHDVGKSGSSVIRVTGRSAVWLWKLMEQHLLPEYASKIQSGLKAHGNVDYTEDKLEEMDTTGPRISDLDCEEDVAENEGENCNLQRQSYANGANVSPLS